MASSVLVKSLTPTSVDQLIRIPPTVLLAVADAVDRGPGSARAGPARTACCPCAVIAVIGRSAAGPVTSTPLPPLLSTLIPIRVVPRSPRSTSPSATDSDTVTASSRARSVRSSLESDAVAQERWCARSMTVLFWLSDNPARGPGSVGTVPRSLTVESMASNRPPPATTMKGRPGPTGSGAPKLWSAERHGDPAQGEPAAAGVDRSGVRRRRPTGQLHRLDVAAEVQAGQRVEHDRGGELGGVAGDRPASRSGRSDPGWRGQRAAGPRDLPGSADRW